MKQHPFIVALSTLMLGTALLSGCTEVPRPFHQRVNPFIGTGGHGHTYPGATAPFGMVQLSPDTRLTGWDGCGGYHYSDSVIYGFSHTHLQGTGVSDYGDILFAPCTQFQPGRQIGLNGIQARFRTQQNKRKPGITAFTWMTNTFKSS